MSLLSRAQGAVLRLSLLFTPRPTALAIRRVFASSTVERAARQLADAPPDVHAIIDEPYGDRPDERIDIYRPVAALQSRALLPTVFWTHGGAFVGGTKDELGGYLRSLAHEGFTVVAVRYSLAPEATHPTPARQIMAALGHLQQHADRLGVDRARIVFAGDSAGAQLSAQVVAAIHNPDYAARLGILSLVTPAQVAGVVLCCGVYDFASLAQGGPFGNVLFAAGWAYSGSRNFRADTEFVADVSLPAHIGASFPPTFITAGNADPLEPQSLALAADLESKGVEVVTLFYAADHVPALPHEYQFEPDLDDGIEATRRIVAFIQRCVGRGGVSAGTERG